MPLLCLMRLSMLPLRHHNSPAGGGLVAAWDDNSDLQLRSPGGCCSSLWAVPLRLEKSHHLLPQLKVSSFKRKRFESKLSPESRYSRGGVLAWKIIYEHNITEAIQEEKRWGSFQTLAFKCPSQLPVHHIRECHKPFSDPVCDQKGLVWQLEHQTATAGG